MQKLLVVAMLLAGYVMVAPASGSVEAAMQKKRSTKSSKKRRTKKKATPVKVAPPKALPENVPLVGTWYTLDSSGKFSRANKFVFVGNTFKYIGPGWSSEGTYRRENQTLNLTWTKIDNQPVKPGTVKKALELGENLKTFKLDRFTYGKAS